MRNIIVSVVMALFMIGCFNRKQAAAPFDLPEGVVYESKDEIGLQSFRWGTNDTMALFMMSPHPAGLSREMVETMASATTSQLEPELRKVEGVKDLKKQTLDITAGHFTGKEIICMLSMSDGKTVYQSMYLLWDGTRLWQGQMSGSQPKDLEMVRTILDAMK